MRDYLCKSRSCDSFLAWNMQVCVDKCWQIIPTLKTCKTAANSWTSLQTSVSNPAMFREMTESPRAASHTQQASVSMLIVKVQDNKLEKGWRLFGRRNLLSYKNMAKLHLNNPQDFWISVLRRPKRRYLVIMPTVRHGAGHLEKKNYWLKIYHLYLNANDKSFKLVMM